jgi:hypothetical protein
VQTVGCRPSLWLALGHDIEDTFELLIEVLNGRGAQLMKDATDLLSDTGVRIGPILRDDQEAVKGPPRLANVGCIAVNVAQQITGV